MIIPITLLTNSCFGLDFTKISSQLKYTPEYNDDENVSKKKKLERNSLKKNVL